ncbi:MAG: hypothetical protein ABIP94_13720 [Planctomycetota bacterium]
MLGIAALAMATAALAFRAVAPRAYGLFATRPGLTLLPWPVAAAIRGYDTWLTRRG